MGGGGGGGGGGEGDGEERLLWGFGGVFLKGVAD